MNPNINHHTLSMDKKHRLEAAERRAKYNLIIQGFEQHSSLPFRTTVLKVLSFTTIITAAIIFATVS